MSTVNGQLTALRERLHIETSEQAAYVLAASGRLRVPELAGHSAATRPDSLPLRAWGLAGARTPA